MRPPLARRAAALAMAIAAGVALTNGGAYAASPSPSPTAPAPSTTTPQPSSSPTSSASPSSTSAPSPRPSAAAPKPALDQDEGAGLSGVVLQAQTLEAERLWGTITAASTELATAMQEMSELSARANKLLESLSKARDTFKEAQAAATAAKQELAALEKRLDAARATLRNWAFSVYSGGGHESDMTGMLDAMKADPSQVGDPLGDVTYLTDQRSRALQNVRVLTAEQARLTDAATAAEAKAKAAQQALEEDKANLEMLMVGQKEKLERLRALQQSEVAKAGPISAALVGARDPRAQAAATKLRTALKSAAVDISDEIGPACSDEDGEYPNGMMPASALCPLWGAPGQSLKPRAAAAFNALSKAYAKQTGHPICVSDSYRSLARQYAVKASRGKWAATPGTSPHGRGIAVDLGCGIQNFGHPAHLWMKQNAHLYGWYHPAWAAINGSLPEPWHWQFAG